MVRITSVHENLEDVHTHKIWGKSPRVVTAL